MTKIRISERKETGNTFRNPLEVGNTNPSPAYVEFIGVGAVRNNDGRVHDRIKVKTKSRGCRTLRWLQLCVYPLRSRFTRKE